MTDIASVVAGSQHSLVLKMDWTLWTAGYNNYGQLGNGTTTNQSTFTQVLTGVESVAAGYAHTLALKTDGTLWATGYNSSGQLGNGTTNQSSFIQVLTGVESMTAGWGHTLALKTNGTLWATGRNSYGQLGNNTTTNRNSFMQVLSGVESVMAGSSHTLALKTDGTLWSTGANYSGQLGNGTTTSQSSFSQVLTEVESVAVGSSHTLALKTDGTLWGTGLNQHGELGNGNTTNRKSFTQLLNGIESIAGGQNHTLALKTDWTLWATGKNDYCQLGNGTTTNLINFTQVLTEVKSMTAWYYHSLALKTDGTLWGVGNNTSGQLGNGTVNQTSFTQVLSEVESVEAGSQYSLVLKTNGTLWATGDNYYGQLGDGTNSHQNSFTQVLTDVKYMAGGNYHVAALKTDWTLWTTGGNNSGQLGNGTTTNQSSFTQVLSGVEAVAGGSYHTLALKTDGTLWATGRNYYGQLGNGSTTDRSSFTQVLSDVKNMAAGGSHSLALKSDGTLWATGANYSGQLGNGTTSNRTSFTQVLGGVKSIATGWSHTLALKTDGTLWTTGQNNLGQLGNGYSGHETTFDWTHSFKTYHSSWTFNSAVIDLNNTEILNLENLNYTVNLPTNTAISVDLRLGDTATPDGTWSDWQTNLANGANLSALGGHRYVQYRANLSTGDETVTPALENLSLDYLANTVDFSTDKPYTATTKDSIQIDTSNWADVNAAVASETLNNSNAWYSVSFDGRTTFAAFDSAQATWRNVARDNAWTWEYNSAISGAETWTACSTNAGEECLSESLETNTVNRMTGTQINAISDENWEASGGFSTNQTTLDLAITLYATSGNPSVNSLTLDYEPVTNIAPNNPTLNNYNNGSTGTDTTPTLSFDLSDPDESEEGEEIKYQIQIDNNADFSSPEVDFTELAFTTSPRASEEYTASGLSDGQWYWRVKTIDDEGLESDWSTATLGFKIDVELPESKILYPQDGASLKNVNYIFGRSTDSQGVDKTRISIRNLTTGKYYTGTGFTADAETWIDTNPTGANQTRSRWWIAAPTWADFQTYTIRSRAIDMAGNEEHTDAITFTYDTVNGSEGSLYVSNPGVDNNSDYTIFYPNTDPLSSGDYIEIDFDNTFAFSPWLEDNDVTLSDNGGNISSSTDSFDRFNKTITSTITAGNVNGGDIIELAVSNLKIHNPSATGSYALPIRIYNSSDILLEAGTGTITLVENYQQVEINVNIAESLQLRVDSGSVLLEVDPDVQLGQNWSGTGGTVSENTEVEVKTNAQGGYNLLISLAGNTATGSAVLDGQVLTGSQITSMTGDRVLVENNFTFGLNTGTAATVTAFNNASTQVSGAGSGNATNSYIDNIFYYLNIDYTTPADTYAGTVTYTAVGQF